MTPHLLIIYMAVFFGIFSTNLYLLTLYENKDKLISPKPKKMRNVTIIVPAFNEEGRIKRTIDSLLSLDYPKDLLEVIIVDDGSTDSTFNEMKNYASGMVKVFHKSNGGKASALNFGIEHSTGEIIVSLDADSFVDRNALINMVGYFDDEKCMAVTPSLKIWKPRNILQRVQFIEYMFGVFLRKACACLGCINVTPGPFSAYRRSFFKECGGYQEGNLTEDIEIALRLQSRNYTIENAQNAYVYTPGPPKFMPLFKQRLRWYLGFMNNVIDYRHLFSRKYGTLGVFFMPSAFLAVALAIVTVSYSLGLLAKNVYRGVLELSAINFDVVSLIDISSFKLSAFHLPNALTMITVMSLAIAFLTIYLARKMTEDKDKLAASLACSVLLYAPLFALWWAAAIAYKLSRKKFKWAGIAWEKD